MKFKQVLALAALTAGLGAVGTSNAVVVYSQDFAGGSSGSYSMNSLWHVTSNFGGTSGFALGYVRNETQPSAIPDGNYDTGVTNSGTALSPGIVIPGSGATTLTLKAFNHNEFGDAPDFFDRLRVSVSTDGGATSTVLASTSPDDSASQVTFPYWTGVDEYQNLVLDLTSFDGMTINLLFGYDTLDSLDNNHPGARITDIAINGTPEPGTMLNLALGLVALGWLGRRKAA